MDQRRPTGQDPAPLNRVIRLDGGMQTDEAATQLPTTYQLVIEDRVVNYCLYGPEDGVPVVSHNGSPSTRWKRPNIVAAIERAGVRMLVHDRPGYGGSTRAPGRRVADVAEDVRLLADAVGWDRFAIHGHSGGGPYALASAALLPDRVSRCAVGAGLAPSHARGVDFFGRLDPSRGQTLRLALEGEDKLRPFMAEGAARIMATIAEGGPEMLQEPGEVATSAPTRAIDDPEAMARLHATFVDSLDGWIDDQFAFVHPWGFDVSEIAVPVGIWHGSRDTRMPRAHSDWLTANIPTAERFDYEGWHVPSDDVFREMFSWLRC
jgi:pimeloyl-ACP methyl ester carboxylesterase